MTNLFYLPECTSTQDEIENFISAESIHPQAVFSFNQTKGKGQYGNTWELSKDLNIAYSLAIPLELIKLPNHLFNFHTAGGLADFIANMTNQIPEIKWPNDMILNGKKIAGILIEKKMLQNKSWFVVGIGLNVNQRNFTDIRNAGSLLTQTKVTFDLHIIGKSLHSFMQTHLIKETSEESVLEKMNSHLFRKNRVSVFEIKGVRQNGIIKEIDAEGFLWVQLEKAGLQKFFHKEISLLY